MPSFPDDLMTTDSDLFALGKPEARGIHRAGLGPKRGQPPSHRWPSASPGSPRPRQPAAVTPYGGPERHASRGDRTALDDDIRVLPEKFLVAGLRRDRGVTAPAST